MAGALPIVTPLVLPRSVAKGQIAEMRQPSQRSHSTITVTSSS
jgi:hypothetical protein